MKWGAFHPNSPFRSPEGIAAFFLPMIMTDDFLKRLLMEISVCPQASSVNKKALLLPHGKKNAFLRYIPDIRPKRPSNPFTVCKSVPAD
ncbi:hypothetical protein RJP21_07690 [Paenibacillus sp. VCA1]|uniref:hypothetical protein n=1 Tax=Paenibacillus sp. VCA1 TaxID=3039148 RepID=UPI0028714AF5|nr:hypothetical protein [Paenibacillus sp. VCA1]MDR9853477.1 hypothetical protein [Paenibacillus sp. VCA1]